jgi:carboxypeptidase C (cathepsin A)
MVKVDLDLDFTGYINADADLFSVVSRSNWMGNLAWVEELQWAGKDTFNNSTIPFVLPDGRLGGDGRTAKVGDKGRLTFLKIFGAGHMVRYIDLHACSFAQSRNISPQTHKGAKGSAGDITTYV